MVDTLVELCCCAPDDRWREGACDEVEAGKPALAKEKESVLNTQVGVGDGGEEEVVGLNNFVEPQID